MKESVAREWITALRSGSYSQGENRLKHTFSDGREAYCCLGVLCDITNIGRWVGNDYLILSKGNDEEYHEVLEEYGLLPQIQEQLGMNSSERDALIDFRVHEHEDSIVFNTSNIYNIDWNGVHLTHLNDNGYSFEDIANVIEEYWEII